MDIDLGTRLRISKYNFDVDMDSKKTIEILKSVNLPFQECKYTDRSKSKIALKQIAVCLSLWVIWQFTAGFVPISYQLQKLEPNIENIDYVANYLRQNSNFDDQKSNHLIHRFEELKYDREINHSNKVISFYLSRVMKWGEYESSFQRVISFM